MNALVPLSGTHVALPQETKLLVTMQLDNQRFGIPVQFVRDVLRDQKIAPIPKAPCDIAGSINLRGRIVTVIDMRQRLRLTTQYDERPMFIVVDFNGEFFSLLVDAVSEVMSITSAQVESPPSNLSTNWREISSGVCQRENDLLVIIDINALLGV